MNAFGIHVTVKQYDTNHGQAYYATARTGHVPHAATLSGAHAAGRQPLFETEGLGLTPKAAITSAVEQLAEALNLHP